MGTFDYERLKNTVNTFNYIFFNFPADFSKSNILENGGIETALLRNSNSWIFILCSSHRPLPEGFPVILKQTNDAVSIRKLN